MPRCFGELRRVHERHRLVDDRAEHTLQDREREHAAVVVGDLAFVGRPRASSARRRRGPENKPAEAFGERQERPHALRRLRRGDVDRERHEVAAQREHHLLGDRLARLVLRLGGGRAEVRRDDDVVEPEQRRLGGRLLSRTCRSRRRRGGRSRSRRPAPSSSTMPPRPALISRSPGFACASTSAFTSPIVSGVLVAWIVTKSQIGERARRSSATSCTPSWRARSALTNGSYATSRIPNAWARCATSTPTRPRPTMPSVLPCSSTPSHFERFHCPALRSALACGTLRACASSSAIVCSAAERMFDCGAFTTITPRRVASATSTLSRPMPARPTTTRSVPAASTSAVTWVALRITSAGRAGDRGEQLLGREAGLARRRRGRPRASRRARVRRGVRRREHGVPSAVEARRGADSRLTIAATSIDRRIGQIESGRRRCGGRLRRGRRRRARSDSRA